MSESLAAALAAFQAEAPTVAKTKTAQVTPKNGGSYSYSYADLADVCEAAYPLLAKHGLAFSCAPDLREGWVIVGKLIHTSGDSIEGCLPLYGDTPQALGSSITYMRRYLLGSLTGIVTDTDDDAQAAQHSSPRAAGSPRPASEKQVQFVIQMGQKKLHDLTTEADFLDWLTDKTGRLIESPSQLTSTEASGLLDLLKEMR